ncbi:MAG TPA: hypothetical protein VMH27_20355 [Puia sp.]|nr:hypothetical protein [Puia sp.]
MKRVFGVIIGVILLVLVIFFVMRYYFVFGEGVKAGTLNYVVKKGYLFKTYEGEMILTGLQSKAPASMQSNEFTFSITDAALAQKLMLNSGREMQLHYKEYVGSVPWRGYSKFVVDSVVMITNPVAAPPQAAPVK